MPFITVKPPRREYPRFRHPWVYRSQIEDIQGKVSAGDVVEVRMGRRTLGTGYYNPNSEIAVRILSSVPAVLDERFFKAKIEKALRYREKSVRDTNAYRVISSEADGLPGFIADRYAEILVVQFVTLGAERLREAFLAALRQVIPSKGIFERSDSSSRKIEGLETRVGWVEKSCGDETEVYESDVRYSIRFGEGHKTGIYLDQRDNRLLLRDLGMKGSVLDAFCYEGGFGLHLALRGCQVLGIDIQEEAVRAAEGNRKLNGVSEESLRFRVGNVFDELKRLEREKVKFDCVILDPPSFVRKKAALAGAMAGYKEILLRSMKILNDGGTLAVFSCSYHIDENLLMQAILSAALDTRKILRVLKFLKQSADHPINPFIPETYYLKGFLLEVDSNL